MNNFDAGWRTAIAAVAAWHDEQSRSFSTPSQRLDAASLERFRWASASHASHATYIRRSLGSPPARSQ